MRTVVSISLPGEILKELNSLAKKTGRNKSDIIKEALSLFLWETKLKDVQRRLGRRAKKIGIVTEEDVFREIS
ncbi:MAG: ribbon-helix-helix protein, CopG family [Thermodesulfovibrionales bacterium]